MDVKVRVLQLKTQAPEAQEILERPALELVDVLQRPQIDAFVLVGGEECFFDAMDAPIRHHHHVQKIAIETDEEFELDDQEEQEKERKDEVTRG